MSACAATLPRPVYESSFWTSYKTSHNPFGCHTRARPDLSVANILNIVRWWQQRCGLWLPVYSTYSSSCVKGSKNALQTPFQFVNSHVLSMMQAGFSFSFCGMYTEFTGNHDSLLGQPVNTQSLLLFSGLQCRRFEFAHERNRAATKVAFFGDDSGR